MENQSLQKQRDRDKSEISHLSKDKDKLSGEVEQLSEQVIELKEQVI